jgi:hypothetical protein
MIKRLSGRLRTRARSVTLVLAAAALAATGALVATTSAVAPPSAVHDMAFTPPSTQTPAGVALPDPGFSEFGHEFYIYGTGEGFPVATSARWNGPYAQQDPVLAAQPAWLGTCGKLGNAEWAPQVFRSQKAYVMYYTACDGRVRAVTNCVGIATSPSPASGFRPAGNPICAPASQKPGSEAIDPSPYR